VSCAAAVDPAVAAAGGRIYVADKRAPSSVTRVTSSSVTGDARSARVPPPHAAAPAGSAGAAAAAKKHPGISTASSSAAAAKQSQRAAPAGRAAAGATSNTSAQRALAPQQQPLPPPPGLSTPQPPPPPPSTDAVPQLQSALGAFLSRLGVSRDLTLVYLTRNQAGSGTGLTQEAVHLEEVVAGRGVLQLTWRPVNT
jgi:hypothetical protein